MTIETDINVMEYAGRTWRFTLQNESGEVLPLDGYVIYGAAECPGQALRAFTVEVKGGVATVRMPGLPVGDWPWKYQLFVLEVSSRVEWLLCCGSVNVLGRVAGGHVALSPEQLEFTGVLDRVTQQASIVVGENMVSIAENARRATQAALDSQIARGDAEAAREGAQVAQAGAEAARDGALAARSGTEDARDGALAARSGAEAARDGAWVARSGAEDARDGALAARSGAEDARGGALAARSGAEDARDGALAALAGAEGAQAVAEDAAGVAQGFAQRAAGAADEAVLAAAEAKAAEAGSAAAADVVRYDFLPMTLEWLEGRFTKTLGEGNFSMTYTEEENTLRVAFALETTEAQIEESRALLDRVLPRKLVTEIDPFPSDFTRLEYLEAPCGETYISTGIKQRLLAYLDYMNVQYGWREYIGMWGIERYYKNNRGGCWCAISDTRVTFYAAGEFDLSAQERHQVIHVLDAYRGAPEARSKIGFCIDGTWKCYANDGDLQQATTYTYRLFARNARERLYKARFTDVNHKEIANYVPALDTTGSPCMFDTVTRKAFYNSGTGDFTYPGKETEATTYSLRDRMYAQYTEHGIRRLYRVPEGYSSKEEYAAANGFKILVETPMPAEGYWTPVWHDREDCIELEWVETEAPIEEETLTGTE